MKYKSYAVFLGILITSSFHLTGCGTESSGGEVLNDKLDSLHGRTKEKDESCDNRRNVMTSTWAGDPNCGPEADSRLIAKWEASENSPISCELTMPLEGESKSITAIQFNRDETCEVLSTTTHVACTWSVNWDSNYVIVNDSQQKWAFIVRYQVEDNSLLLTKSCRFNR